MTDELKGLIWERLGDAVEEVRFRVADRIGVAYRGIARSERCRGAKNYYQAQTEEQLSVDRDTALRERDVRFYVGDGGTRLYAIPGLPPLDIVELARVGTHNGRKDEWKEVRDLLLATVSQVGFDVVFADEAGIECRLARPIEPALAIEWDRTLLDRMGFDRPGGNPRLADSYSFMCDAPDLQPVAGADERGGGLVPAYILKHGALRLWWD